VLREVAQLMRARVRGEDTVVRYGGEEFVVLMPETTLPNAALVANDLCKQIGAHVIVNRGVSLSVTVSIGCAELLSSDADSGDLVLRADGKLYEAKHAGRNRVGW
jgi:diguanylate cyclase (GGDEF)-like protein